MGGKAKMVSPQDFLPKWDQEPKDEFADKPDQSIEDMKKMLLAIAGQVKEEPPTETRPKPAPMKRRVPTAKPPVGEPPPNMRRKR